MGATSEQVDLDPFVGRVFDERFEIVELIARGGMGKVYRARQKPLGREIALKVLDPRYEGEHDPDFEGRFFLEASTVAKLSHPNTVTVFDYGRTPDGVYFIAMELVEGETLATVLRHEGPLDILRAIHIALQIARSVREAHGLGVVHRDLKPPNVLLTQHDEDESFVKVLDFGLAKDLKDEEDHTQQGLFMGSPKYMSPEAIQGSDIDARADIYSLGVMLYQMLCGRVPFAGATSMQTLMAHVNEGVPPLSRADGRLIPIRLQQVVQRSLAKLPQDRFSSMQEMIHALKVAAADLGSPIQGSGAYSLSSETILGPDGATPSGGVRIEGLLDGEGRASWAQGTLKPPPASEPEIVVETTRRFKLPFIALAAAALLIATGAWVLWPREPAPLAASPSPPTVTSEQDEPATARCEVTLTSSPSGAEVWVGARGYGQTPANIVWEGEAAEPGKEVTFLFELNGHRSATLTRTINAEGLEVHAELAPLVAEQPMVEAPAQRPAAAMRARRAPRMRAAPMMSAEAIDVSLENYRDNPY